MKQLSSRLLCIAILAGLLAVGPASPAAAIGAFGPVQEVARPPCIPIDGIMEVDGDLVAMSDGVLRGFLSFNGSADCEGSEIWYVERRNGRWSRQLSPYTGFVLAVAVDSTGTYLLHTTIGGALRATKRSAAGGFTGGRQLSAGWALAGDLVASGGSWWAVWSETASPADGAPDLFQAKTIGSDLLTKQNLTNSPAVHDRDPSLVLRPESRTSLAWDLTNPASPFDGAGRLGVGTADSGGRWNLRRFELTPPTPGVAVGEPEFAYAGGISHLIWTRWSDGGLPRVLTANDRGGWNSVKVFNTAGTGPRIAMSSGKVFAAWNAVGTPRRVFAAERPTASGGLWTGTTVSATSPSDQRVLAVSGFGGKATVLIWDRTRVYSRTQT